MSAEGEWSPFEVRGEALTHEDAELEAEEETVEVLPSFEGPAMELLSGEVGPFRPQVPTRVPLWLAMQLRKKGKCRVVPPAWLEAGSLDEMLEREREVGQRAFGEVPFRYLEVGTQLLKHARHDVPDWEQVSDKLETLRERRAQKLQEGVRNFNPDTLASVVPRLDNLAAMEVSLLRRPFTASLDRFYRHLPSQDVSPPSAQQREPAPPPTRRHLPGR